MSQYVNLDDPEVTYSHNAGLHEVYIIGSEVERIDLVRCEECVHEQSCGRHIITVARGGQTFYHSVSFCSNGERRADDE